MKLINQLNLIASLDALKEEKEAKIAELEAAKTIRLSHHSNAYDVEEYLNADNKNFKKILKGIVADTKRAYDEKILVKEKDVKAMCDTLVLDNLDVLKTYVGNVLKIDDDVERLMNFESLGASLELPRNDFQDYSLVVLSEEDNTIVRGHRADAVLTLKALNDALEDEVYKLNTENDTIRKAHPELEEYFKEFDPFEEDEEDSDDDYDDEDEE